MRGDDDGDGRFIARKVGGLRIFTDANGKMNLNVTDVSGAILAVSQFTLAADTSSGTRPSFSGAMDPVEGRRLFELVCDVLQEQGIQVVTGVFGAKMELELVNDGPVTIALDSRRKV
jgi:D-tyrosyl-tRNA(Tyr) deacylase